MVDSSKEVRFLDRPAARLCAVGVALLMAAALAFMHRDDLFPPAATAGAEADDPVARCLAERGVDIDKMAADGTITRQQAELFRSRAEALCQSQAGGGNNVVPPPQ